MKLTARDANGNIINTTGWLDGNQINYGGWTVVELSFTPTLEDVTLEIELRANYGLNNNGWFIDEVEVSSQVDPDDDHDSEPDGEPNPSILLIIRNVLTLFESQYSTNETVKTYIKILRMLLDLL